MLYRRRLSPILMAPVADAAPLARDGRSGLVPLSNGLHVIGASALSVPRPPRSGPCRPRQTAADRGPFSSLSSIRCSR